MEVRSVVSWSFSAVSKGGSELEGNLSSLAEVSKSTEVLSGEAEAESSGSVWDSPALDEAIDVVGACVLLEVVSAKALVGLVVGFPSSVTGETEFLEVFVFAVAVEGVPVSTPGLWLFYPLTRGEASIWVLPLGLGLGLGAEAVLPLDLVLAFRLAHNLLLQPRLGMSESGKLVNGS